MIRERHPEQATCPRAGDDGFTLVEVLVALTILSVSLAVLFGIFSQNLAMSEKSWTHMEARELAQAKLAEAQSLAPADLQDASGQTPSGLKWQLQVSPYGSEADRNAWTLNPVTISVTALWSEKGHSNALTLSTLRLLPKPSQPAAQ